MPASPDRGAERWPGAGTAAIRCRDLAAMTAFYRDILDFEVAEGDSSDTTVMLRAGEAFAASGLRVALFLSENDEEAPPAPHHLTLTVADREALVRAGRWFRANGVACESAELGWAGWECLTVRDPEGNVVELAAPVRQRTLPAEAGHG